MAKAPRDDVVLESWRDAILILLAHGSEATASGADLARRHADTLRALGHFSDVKAAFLRDTPHPRDLIATEQSRDIYVVPFMASDGYSIDTLVPDALGLSGPLTERIAEGTRRRMHMCRPVGTHDSLLDWLGTQVETFVSRFPPTERPSSIVVASHGTERHAGNFDRTRDVVETFAARGLAQRIEAVFIDQQPSLDTWRDLVDPGNVLVVPYLMNLGGHSRRDVPSAFGFTDEDAFRELAAANIAGPFEVEGRQIHYGPLLGSSPLIPSLCLERVRQWDGPWDGPWGG